MSEPQTNQQPSSGMTFDAQPVQQDTPVSAPADSGMTFDSAPVQADTTIERDGKPRFAPYNAASFGRYTTPENYEKWASVQPKIGPDSRPGEYEAWTSANTPGGAMETLKTIPIAAAETLAGITGASVAGPLIASSPELVPLAAKAVEYLKHLDNIVKVAKTLGYAGFGIEQAHNIYKWVSSGDDKKKSAE